MRGIRKMAKATILCVDDEETILNSLKIQLKNEFKDSYVYEMAESADEALEILAETEEDENKVILIISDWLMPGMKGDEFLIKVRKKYPETVKIMLTGQAEEAAIARARREADLYCCLHKPWDGKELIAAIKSGIAAV